MVRFSAFAVRWELSTGAVGGSSVAHLLNHVLCHRIGRFSLCPLPRSPLQSFNRTQF